jgi:hypothetical protein
MQSEEKLLNSIKDYVKNEHVRHLDLLIRIILIPFASKDVTLDLEQDLN